MDIHIENCNNIKSANVCINDNKLNIFFGRNGSGKSTIAKAISKHFDVSALEGLRPYGVKRLDNQPLVTGVNDKSIMVFNDEYVKQYVYQRKSVLDNAFDILVRTPDYDAAKEVVDTELYKLKNVVIEDESIRNMITKIEILLSKIKVGTNNQIDKRSAKGILDGKGAYFNPPKELESMKPFFEDQNVTKWAAWRLQGYDQFGKKGICPYCAIIDDDNTEKRNKIFSEKFDKSSVETANLIISTLDGLNEFIDAEKIAQLKSYFGPNGNTSSLETHLIRLNAEANHLYTQLTKIRDFNGSKVDKENIKDLEKMLSEMKIDFSAIDSYFTTKSSKDILCAVNNKIDELINSVGNFKRRDCKI